MADDATVLLEKITAAFARGDDALGHELVAEAVETYELPTEVVAAALSAGVEARFSVPAGAC